MTCLLHRKFSYRTAEYVLTLLFKTIHPFFWLLRPHPRGWSVLPGNAQRERGICLMEKAFLKMTQVNSHPPSVLLTTFMQMNDSICTGHHYRYLSCHEIHGYVNGTSCLFHCCLGILHGGLRGWYKRNKNRNCHSQKPEKVSLVVSCMQNDTSC